MSLTLGIFRYYLRKYIDVGPCLFHGQAGDRVVTPSGLLPGELGKKCDR
jgi:hypothetical protein